MKQLIVFLALSLNSLNSFAQEGVYRSEHIIHCPRLDAQQSIKTALKQAAKEKKHVLLLIGNNSCVRCIRFDNTVYGDSVLRKQMDDNFVVAPVNSSPENKNEKVLASLGYPQRFGFPVFVVLDAKGNRLHTQNSAYLEEGKGYSKEKIAEFFKHWSPTALNPASYQEKAKN